MDKTTIHSQVKGELNSRRNSAIFKADENYKKFRENPKFAELDNKKRSLVLEIGKLQFEEKDTGALEKEYERVEEQIANLAKENKVELQCLKPDYYYVCKKCGDTGFVNGEMCSCYKMLLSKQILDANKMRDKLPSFDDFDETIFDDAKQAGKMKTFLQNYINKFPNVHNVFVLQGGVGVGKTFASELIFNELIKKGVFGIYYSAFDLFAQISKVMFGDRNEREEIEHLIAESELLVIDDVGTEQIFKNITLEYWQHILDARHKSGLPIILSTNLSIEQFKEMYGERLCSRIFFSPDCVCLKVDNCDLRKKLKIGK